MDGSQRSKLAATVLAGWLLGACSRTPAEVTPEPSVVPVSVAPTTAPPTTAPPTSVVLEDPIPPVDPTAPVVPLAATPGEVRDRWVAELDVEDLELPQGHVVRVLHPNATIRSRLDALIASSLGQIAAQASAGAADDGTEPNDLPRCNALVATRTIVSIVCESEWEPAVRGGGSESIVTSFAFQIVGDEVQPTSLEAGLVPGAHYVEATDRAFRDAYEASYDPGMAEDANWIVQDRAIGSDGIAITWGDGDEWSGAELRATVPYEDIVDQIRSDGPIARMLHLGAYARGATRPTTDATGAPTSSGPWIVGAAMPISEAAFRWAALPDNLRSAVSAYVTGDLAHLGVRAAVGVEAAREVATALHGTLAAAPTDAVVRAFELRGVNGSVNVRVDAASIAPWLATLPRDAVTIVLVDPAAPDGDWLHVIAAPGIEGWSSGRYLDPSECLPDGAAAIAALPEAVREQAARTLLRIDTTVFDASHAQRAALFIAHDATHGYVSLRRLSTTCRVGSALASWTLDGVVVDALVTRTTQQGGDTLVLVQTATDATYTAGPTHWLALRTGTPTAVWDETFATHPSQTNELRAPVRVGPSGRGFWPMAVVARHAPIVPYRWEGHTLVRDTP